MTKKTKASKDDALLRRLNAEPMRDPALLRCPFCGSHATIEYWHGQGPQTRMISCESEQCEVGPSVVGATKARAIKLWNSRAPKAEEEGT